MLQKINNESSNLLKLIKELFNKGSHAEAERQQNDEIVDQWPRSTQ